MFLVKMMNKIKKYFIHLLGGMTEEEHNALSLSALAKLTKDNKQLQQSLRALEHAVEDSRVTGRVNVVRTEKPLRTLRIQSVLEPSPRQTEEEAIVEAKRYLSKQFVDRLLKDNMIDFKVSDYGFEKIITGTVHICS